MSVPSGALWKTLLAAKKAAKPGEQVFSYVDILADENLPLWMDKASLQGSNVKNEVKDDADSALVGLAESLNKQVARRKRIKSVGQWLTLFDRYVLVAVCTGQVTWAFATMYRATICKLYEDQRARNKPLSLAWDYDEAFRKYAEQMTEAKIQKFDLMEEAQTLNKVVLESCESKIAQTTTYYERSSASGGSGAQAVGAALNDEARAEHERRKALKMAENMAMQAKAQQARHMAIAAAQRGEQQPVGVSNAAWKEAMWKTNVTPTHRSEPYGKGKKDGGGNGKSGGKGKSNPYGKSGGGSWGHR